MLKYFLVVVSLFVLLGCGYILFFHPYQIRKDLKTLFGDKIEFLSWPYSEFRTKKVQHIVVHSFAFDTSQMIQKLDEMGLSSHYLIDTDGHITQMVPPYRVAWHAGKSFWRGQKSLNKTSIGIELQNDTLGQTPFTEAQLDSFEKLTLFLMDKYKISPENVVGHSDIAPTRKVDPGKAFPWKKMAEKGIGTWNDQGDDLDGLSDMGYDITNVKAARLAYRRHYHPDLISTDMDISHLEEHLIEEVKE